MTPPATPLEWAAIYAGFGWRTLPIKPNGKHPPMASWQHAATVDPDTHAKWWNGLYRNHGIGIATGDELWVLDIDTHDADGPATLRALEAEHGTLPLGPTSTTGGGGEHRLFLPPPGRHVGTTKNIGPGLDVRGRGGQIVAPPTIHATTGVPYSWKVAPDTPLRRAPLWLEQLVIVGGTPCPHCGSTNTRRIPT